MFALVLALAITIPLTADATRAADKTATTSADAILVPSVPAQWPGKIFVSGDEWVLSDVAFQTAPDTERFVVNLTGWFTNGRRGNFLGYSTNFGLTQPQLAGAMAAAGHSWTVGTDMDLSLPALLRYDGIFLAGTVVDNAVLIDYVRAGGNVFLEGGTGWGRAPGEAASWNTFLNAFGLNFEPIYVRPSLDALSIIPGPPVFEGVHGLLFNFGNPISKLHSADPDTQILLSVDGYGMFATYETGAIAVAVEICPNRISLGSRGALSVAIAGTADLDVRKIDPASVRIIGVAPRDFIFDHASVPVQPLIGKTTLSTCAIRSADKHLDLVWKFDSEEVVQAVAAALGRPLGDGDVVALTLTGRLKAEFGGNPIVGEDLVIIKTKAATSPTVKSNR
jgi:hypothetical protein